MTEAWVCTTLWGHNEYFMIPWAICIETVVEVWAYKASWKSWLVFTLHRCYGIGQDFWALKRCDLTHKVEEGVTVWFLKVSVDMWVACAKCWVYSLWWVIETLFKKAIPGIPRIMYPRQQSI